MIVKITYRCETCGKERVVEPSENSSRIIPKDWRRDEHVSAGYSLDFCSELCREKYVRMHTPLGISPPKGPKVLPIQLDGDNLLRSMFESAQHARDEAVTQLASEFGVPPETVPEFGFHLQTIACPRCGAGSGEACKVMEGDATTACPVHGQEELKSCVHKERISAAKKSWGSKFQ
jgi:hypothetical protein